MFQFDCAIRSVVELIQKRVPVLRLVVLLTGQFQCEHMEIVGNRSFDFFPTPSAAHYFPIPCLSD
jgi:hypothetical protein